MRAIPLPAVLSLSLVACAQTEAEPPSGEAESTSSDTLPSTSSGSSKNGSTNTGTNGTGTGSTSSTIPEEPDSQMRAVCERHSTESACMNEQQQPCIFHSADEVILVDGTCTVLEDDIGWCDHIYYALTAQVISWWYEEATGRVLRFPDRPPSPPGWAECECLASEPAACGCNPECADVSPSTG